MNNDDLTLKNLMATICADIQIKLLCEEDHETLKDKLYTAEEIINQMKKTILLMHNILEHLGYDTDKKLIINRLPNFFKFQA